MFALLEFIGEVFGLLDATATLARSESRTYFASLLLFGALLLVAVIQSPHALDRDDVVWVGGLVAAELVAALVAVTLLHAIRPVGEDLPARSWSTIMADLANHFGDNAELDAAATRHITEYLAANAADSAKQNHVVLRDLAPTEAPARITALPWWTRKHERRDRVAPAALARAGAKFKGDCKACHQDAERGIFDDD